MQRNHNPAVVLFQQQFGRLGSVPRTGGVLVEMRSRLLKRPPINEQHQLGLLMRDN